MTIRTVHLNVSAPRDSVFSFLADIENLPRWATGFCERVYPERGRWKALTPRGEFYCDLEANDATGVIDLRAGPAPDRMALLPIRVIAMSARTTLIVLAFVEAPEWPAGLCQRDPDEVMTELTALAHRFGTGRRGVEPAPLLVELGVN